MTERSAANSGGADDIASDACGSPDGARNGDRERTVSKQYVDAAVANRAVDSVVVHLAGAEMIQGAKQFAAAPAVPTPTAANSAANKAYVDNAVFNVGAGNFVAKAGDSMTGPLTLAGDPTATNHAANRHNIDTGLTGKSEHCKWPGANGPAWFRGSGWDALS